MILNAHASGEPAMRRFGWLTLIWLSCLGLLSVSTGRCEESAVFDEASLEFFEKEVRPILVARCFECHAGGDRAPEGRASPGFSGRGAQGRRYRPGSGPE